MTVWRQAQSNKVPCIAFINKLDKPNADIDMTLDSMKTKLGLEPILTQIPMGKDLIDLVSMKKLSFDAQSRGATIEETCLDLNDSEIKPKRLEFLEKISEFDDAIAEKIINEEDIKEEDINQALKQIVHNSKALVTFCGSAYKDYGVQPLLNAIINLLPDTQVVQHLDFMKNLRPEKDLCAMAFKIVHHPTKGVLTFVRIYSGHLNEGDSIYNMTRNVSEKVTRLSIAYSNEFKQVQQVRHGNIVVISGTCIFTTFQPSDKGHFWGT